MKPLKTMNKVDIHQIAERANRKADKAMALLRKNRKATFFTAVGTTAVFASLAASAITLMLIEKKRRAEADALSLQNFQKLQTEQPVNRPPLPPKYEEQKKQNETKAAEAPAPAAKKEEAPKEAKPAAKKAAPAKKAEPKTKYPPKPAAKSADKKENKA